jgi:2-succinyl-6-hydroxy-2,4-cyclohexadiene-1-carboxylate synthase
MVRASDGVRLYAEVHDAELHGRGVPVLFSCASCTTGENWRSQVAPLTAAGARVMLWDYRGHGRSDAPEDPGAYDFDQVVADLGSVLDWASPDEPAVLAGLSFGGLASLHFALRNPGRVRGLLLVASGPGFKNPKAAARWQAQADRTADLLAKWGLEAFLRGRAGATCIGRDPQLPAARVAAQAIVAQNPLAVGAFTREVGGAAPSVIDELPSIDKPALIVVGEEDEVYHRAAEVMAAKLPRATRKTIPGAGHIVNIEAPQEFNATAIRFLEEL